MKTKKDLNRPVKKLASYSALASAFIAFGPSADAQVFYTDITDAVLDENGEVFGIDLNGDLIDDVQVRKVFFSFFTSNLYTTGGGSAPGIMQMNHIYATPLNANSIAGTPSPYSFSGYPYALQCSSVIDAGRQWLNSNSEIVAYSLLYKFSSAGGGFTNSQQLSDGNWFGGDTTDRYLGIKLDIAGAKKYGWLRMAVSSDNKSVTLKDFAFENTSDLMILAGAPNVTPENCDPDTVEPAIQQFDETSGVAAYSFGNSIFINLSHPVLIGAGLYVTDITGNIVYSGILRNEQENISLEESATGIYILHIAGSNGTYTKQLFITSAK